MSDAPPGVGDCTPAPTDCSLRQAISLTDEGDPPHVSGPFPIDRIEFAPGLTGTIELAGTELPLIDEDLAISGPGHDALAITAAYAQRRTHALWNYRR